MLAHELAHLKRGDHWVRRLELLVLGLHWWNPVAWVGPAAGGGVRGTLLRRAWVAWALPGAAEAYAEALVATAAFLAGHRLPRASGATGAGRVSPLRRRLSMILRDPSSGSGARPAPGAALIFGGLCLLVLPALAPDGPPEPAGAAAPAAPAIAKG